MADGFEVGKSEFAAAEERGRSEIESRPRAVSARYDQETDRVVIDWVNGCTLLIPPKVLRDAQDATPEQLADVEVSPTGFALHWPQIDADFSVAG